MTSTQGDIAYAVDAGELMIRRETGWYTYMFDDMVGNYTPPGMSSAIKRPILSHLDATDITSLKDRNNLNPVDGEHVKHWLTQPNGGIFDVAQTSRSRQPIYTSQGMNGQPGVKFTGGSLPSRGCDMITERTEQNTRTYQNGYTAIMVCKIDSRYSNYMDVGRVDSEAAWPTGTNNDPLHNQPTHALWGSNQATQSESGPHTNHAGWYISEADYYANLYGTGTHGGHKADLVDQWSYHPHGSHGTNGPTQATGYEGHPEYRNGDIMIFTWRVFNDPYDKNKQRVAVTETTTNGFRARYQKTDDDSIVAEIGLIKGMRIGSMLQREKTFYQDYTGRITVGEFMLFDGNLNNYEMDQVGQYLSSKWSTDWNNLV